MERSGSDLEHILTLRCGRGRPKEKSRSAKRWDGFVARVRPDLTNTHHQPCSHTVPYR